METIVKEYLDKLKILVSSNCISFDENLRRNLPVEGGVYRVFEKSSDWDESIYVGKTITQTLRERVYHDLLMGNLISHTLKRKLIKSGVCKNELEVKEYLKKECQVQVLIIQEERERTFFEHFSISVLKPKYND